MPQIFYGTDGTVPSSWTTGTRPTSPAAGQFGYNTTLGSLEIYSGSAWGAIGGGGLGTVAVQTSNFAAASGFVYPVNTTSGAVTVTLPASPVAGNFVTIIDYAKTFGTNACNINPNGNRLSGQTTNTILSTNGMQVTIVYVDSTQGWLQASGNQTSFIGNYTINYLLVAGGGGGASGGGGAGGMTTGSTSITPGIVYTVTVGAGGAGSTSGYTVAGANGGNTAAFSLTAIGGGRGSIGPSAGASSGGSGGGASRVGDSAGSGTAGQGNAGGLAADGLSAFTSGGGGGGAGAAGTASVNRAGAVGGIGATSTISGSSITYAGGGGGGTNDSTNGSGPFAGGAGGGGAGFFSLSSSGSSGASGTANTGGGGGGTGSNTSTVGGAGGSGICIISYLGAQRGTGGTVTSAGGNTIHTFTSSGTYTA
jgi:hypothetical protein